MFVFGIDPDTEPGAGATVPARFMHEAELPGQGTRAVRLYASLSCQ